MPSVALVAALQARTVGHEAAKTSAHSGYYPGRLNLESRFDPAVRAELVGLGHKVQEWPDWAWGAGAVWRRTS